MRKVLRKLASVHCSPTVRVIGEKGEDVLWGCVFSDQKTDRDEFAPVQFIEGYKTSMSLEQDEDTSYLSLYPTKDGMLKVGETIDDIGKTGEIVDRFEEGNQQSLTCEIVQKEGKIPRLRCQTEDTPPQTITPGKEKEFFEFLSDVVTALERKGYEIEKVRGKNNL